MADSPSTAMQVWIRSPAAMPSPVAMPTRVPEVAARASVSSTAGPGISTKPVSTAR